MALAIGIAVHCDGCVAYHTRAARKHGATRSEVAETGALAVYMGGGPASVYGAEAIRAYDELSQSGTTWRVPLHSMEPDGLKRRIVTMCIGADRGGRIPAEQARAIDRT